LLVSRFLRDAMLIYAGVVVLLLLSEKRLVFQPSDAAHSEAAPSGIGVEDVTFRTTDGTPIHGWWAAPSRWKPGQGAVLFCHGNGGNLSHRGWCLPSFLKQLDRAVLIFDYPGYGKSGGSLGEAGCYAAGEAAYEWLTGERKVPGDQVILFGGSLGSGVAVDLATRRPHRALVLTSPFTSMPEMAQKVFPWLPGRWLIQTQFNNLARIGACPGPVFIAHSATDALIPIQQARRLYAAAPEPKRFFTMEHYQHLDFPSAVAFAALRRFLDETAAQKMPETTRADSTEP
jgi:pimeloyl-ACP methyl ester carboxylesterase